MKGGGGRIRKEGGLVMVEGNGGERRMREEGRKWRYKGNSREQCSGAGTSRRHHFRLEPELWKKRRLRLQLQLHGSSSDLYCIYEEEIFV